MRGVLILENPACAGAVLHPRDPLAAPTTGHHAQRSRAPPHTQGALLVVAHRGRRWRRRPATSSRRTAAMKAVDPRAGGGRPGFPMLRFSTGQAALGSEIAWASAATVPATLCATTPFGGLAHLQLLRSRARDLHQLETQRRDIKPCEPGHQRCRAMAFMQRRRAPGRQPGRGRGSNPRRSGETGWSALNRL